VTILTTSRDLTNFQIKRQIFFYLNCKSNRIVVDEIFTSHIESSKWFILRFKTQSQLWLAHHWLWYL